MPCALASEQVQLRFLVFSFPLCSLAFPLFGILFLHEFQVGWQLLFVHSLWVIHAFASRPLYHAFLRMCYYALTCAFCLHPCFPCVSPPQIPRLSPQAPRAFPVCFLSWILSSVLNASRGLLAVFPVRSLFVFLRFPWVPKSVSRAIRFPSIRGGLSFIYLTMRFVFREFRLVQLIFPFNSPVSNSLWPLNKSTDSALVQG